MFDIISSFIVTRTNIMLCVLAVLIIAINERKEFKFNCLCLAYAIK